MKTLTKIMAIWGVCSLILLGITIWIIPPEALLFYLSASFTGEDVGISQEYDQSSIDSSGLVPWNSTKPIPLKPHLAVQKAISYVAEQNPDEDNWTADYLSIVKWNDDLWAYNVGIHNSEEDYNTSKKMVRVLFSGEIWEPTN